MMSFFGAGIALSSVWALLIIPTLGWRWALFLTAPFALIGGIMRSVLPESPRWLIRVGRVADAESVLRELRVRSRSQRVVSSHQSFPARADRKRSQDRWTQGNCLARPTEV